MFDASNFYSYAFVEWRVSIIRLSLYSGYYRSRGGRGYKHTWGFSWIKNQNCTSIIVEIDCLLIVQAIHSTSVNPSCLDRVIDECKQLLFELKDRSVSLKFVKSCGNKSSQCLVKYCCCFMLIVFGRWVMFTQGSLL